MALPAEHRPSEGLYHINVFHTGADETSDEHLHQVYKDAIHWVESVGHDSGCKFSHANESSNNSLVVVAIAWHAVQANNLKETVARPAECVCNIF